MNTKKAAYPSAILEAGTAILAAAQVVDTHVIKARLDAFADAHRAYADAQRKVDDIEVQLSQATNAIEAEQDEAVETLALAMVADGAPRRGNPFASLGMPSPSAIKALPFDEEAEALRDLVTAVQRRKISSVATQEAARGIAQLAVNVDAFVVKAEGLRNALREVRHTREVIRNRWDTTLAALKVGARYAAGEGAPGLYAALFGRPTRTRKAKAVVVQPVVDKPAAAAVAADQSAPRVA